MSLVEQGKERQERGTNQGANNGGWGTAGAAGARGRCGNLCGSQCCAHGSGNNENSTSNLLHVHDDINICTDRDPLEFLVVWIEESVLCFVFIDDLCLLRLQVWGRMGMLAWALKGIAWSYFGKNSNLGCLLWFVNVWFCKVSGLLNRICVTSVVLD